MRLSVVCLVSCEGLHCGLVGTSVLLSVIVDDKHHHVLCNLHPRFTSADLFYTPSTLLYLSDCLRFSCSCCVFLTHFLLCLSVFLPEGYVLSV